MNQAMTVLVTGGGGYVGAVLVPKLLEEGHSVRVLDTFYFGDDVFGDCKNHPRLRSIKGDLRDRAILERAIPGCEAVIHLAGISDDSSFDFDPILGRSINYDAFLPLVATSKRSGVNRFIHVSCSSVYGINDSENVTEDSPLHPLTDYSKYKAMCEDALLSEREPGFAALVLRPATLCGYSPRLRLDLPVNLLTSQAYHSKKITVVDGEQRRANLHVADLADLCVEALMWPAEKIDGKICNVGWQHLRACDIAGLARREIGGAVEFVLSRANAGTSSRLSSEKIERELGWSPRRTVRDAIRDLVAAFKAGQVPNAASDPRYVNIKTMQQYLSVSKRAAA